MSKGKGNRTRTDKSFMLAPIYHIKQFLERAAYNRNKVKRFRQKDRGVD